MKTQLLVLTLFGCALSAQTPTVLTDSISGVSDTFQNYARQNPTFPPVLDFGDDEGNAIPNQLYLPRGGSNPPTVNATVAAPLSSMLNQTINGTLPVAVSKNYVGLGTGFNGTWVVQGLLPPDTTMGVSTSQILQWVNIKLTVLNKTDGSVALGGSGFVNANQIWSGLGSGSVCATQNQGDPIVQYDRLSGRWVLMQFAFTIGTSTQTQRNYPAPPYAFCWAVSQTSDATGAYNLYQFNVPNLPDYPKLGIWPDGYYLTANDFTYSTATGASSYVGSRVCAFNRAAIIAGGAASSICFSGLNAFHFSMLPGDFEGTILPPAGETSFILSNDWFTKNAPPYGLQLRRFHPDFVTPANSTLNDGFGGAFDSFVSLPFDNTVVGSCGDAGMACVPQPGTPRVLDTLSMRNMYRLAYRNLDANREVLVSTESVGPPGGAAAGIQLIEIRNPAANPPVIYNNVNFNPDSTNRWMGSAATDKLGNVALGYSVSSSILFPGIRVTGRLRNDVRNFVRGEINVQSGSGSQTATAQRWGDYSTMQIDPSDDCTFWYTSQYIINTAPADWATRVVGLKFNNCQ
jgi:hypothetical protein